MATDIQSLKRQMEYWRNLQSRLRRRLRQIKEFASYRPCMYRKKSDASHLTSDLHSVEGSYENVIGKTEEDKISALYDEPSPIYPDFSLISSSKKEKSIRSADASLLPSLVGSGTDTKRRHTLPHRDRVKNIQPYRRFRSLYKRDPFRVNSFGLFCSGSEISRRTDFSSLLLVLRESNMLNPSLQCDSVTVSDACTSNGPDDNPIDKQEIYGTDNFFRLRTFFSPVSEFDSNSESNISESKTTPIDGVSSRQNEDASLLLSSSSRRRRFSKKRSYASLTAQQDERIETDSDTPSVSLTTFPHSRTLCSVGGVC